MSVSINCVCIEDSYILSDSPTTNYGGDRKLGASQTLTKEGLYGKARNEKE